MTKAETVEIPREVFERIMTRLERAKVMGSKTPIDYPLGFGFCLGTITSVHHLLNNYNTSN